MSMSAQEHLFFQPSAKQFFLDAIMQQASLYFDLKVGSPFAEAPTPDLVSQIEKISRVAPEGEPLVSVSKQFFDVVARHSVQFGSPRFLAHPDNGASIAGVVGDLARSMLHQNLVSCEYSPAATHVEYELLRQFRSFVGYANVERTSQDVSAAGGAFVFGGTGANFMSLYAARESLKGRVRKLGRPMNPRRTRVLTKIPYAHYSLRRSLAILGIGNADLTPEEIRELGVEADPRVDIATHGFRMDLDDLERKIEKTLQDGDDILCIFAIGGDSRVMSFDDFEGISRIAERYGIWVHADACEGGQCIVSPKRRQEVFGGVEHCHSISLDPHKVLMLPYSLSMFLLRDVADMSLMSIGTSVIRLGEESFGAFTPGIGSKDFASARLWFLMKHWGTDALAAEIERRHDLASEVGRRIHAHPDFILMNPEVTHNAVGFVFHPREVRLSLESVNKLNKKIHRRLNADCEFFIHMMNSFDPHRTLRQDGGDIVILRMMFGNPATTLDVVLACLDRIVEVGYEILNSTASLVPLPETAA